MKQLLLCDILELNPLIVSGIRPLERIVMIPFSKPKSGLLPLKTQAVRESRPDRGSNNINIIEGLTRSEKMNRWIIFRLSLDKGCVFGVPDFGFDWLRFQGKRDHSRNLRDLEDAIAEDLRVYQGYFSVESVTVLPTNEVSGLEKLRIAIEYRFASDGEICQCEFEYGYN